MKTKQVSASNDLFERERGEISELNDWLAQYRYEDYGKSVTFRTNELGGHVELRKSESENMHMIGPSQEKVHDMLKSYGKKLGIDYVVR